MNYLKIGVISLSFIALFLSCEKVDYITSAGGNLSFSTDTVTFDTIFTSQGSVTKRFKLYNQNNSKILKIRSLYLEGGESSNFRINVDGLPGTEFGNVEIAPNDSLYIFVQAILDPVNSNLPLVVEDAINILADDGTYSIILEAFGQDVHLYKGEIIETSTWINDKPYLIINNLAVDSFHVLTIEKGVRVYFHDNSSLLVWGKLIVNGSMEKPVVFEGSRFDRDYGETAGRWGTIYIDPKSRGNILDYAIIKNPTAGINIGQPEDSPNIPSVELRNCFIQNCSAIGIYAFGAEITAYNTTIADCQLEALAAYMGGTYNFYHSTISKVGAYSPRYQGGYLNDNKMAIILSNYVNWYKLDEYYNVVKATYEQELNANFYNSIITGKNKNQLGRFDNKNKPFNYLFDHCILKASEDSVDFNDTIHFRNVIFNKYPRFINDSLTEGEHDFRLDTLSPAKDSGYIQFVLDNPFLEFDYDGNSRLSDGMPDLGAFERIE